MIGVPVWSRTKKRSFGVVYPSPATASQRISALVPKLTNHSGGSFLAMGDPFSAAAARATAVGVASRAIPRASGTAAPASRGRVASILAAREGRRFSTRHSRTRSPGLLSVDWKDMPCERILWWGCSPGTRRQQPRSETPHLSSITGRSLRPCRVNWYPNAPEPWRTATRSTRSISSSPRSRDVSVRARIVRSSSCSAENRSGPSASEATISTVHLDREPRPRRAGPIRRRGPDGPPAPSSTPTFSRPVSAHRYHSFECTTYVSLMST